MFYDLFAEGFFGKVEAVFHEGACSDTMETDGKYMMDNNYTLSCGLFNACQERGTRLLYASSAAVYGGSETFRETPEFEHPLNVYGYSKLLFDQRMRREMGADFSRMNTKGRQVAGFRYFNVYGPREQHKGRMASVAFHQFNQFRAEGKVKLFGEYAGYGAGRAAARLRLHRRRGGGESLVLRPPRKVRHFQSGDGPGPTVQRRGGGGGQRPAHRPRSARVRRGTRRPPRA